jgi:glucose-1-phosphatase
VISAVLFDMNDVLCRYDRAARVAALARASGRSPAFVEAAIWGSGYEDMADAGAIGAEAYLDGFAERLGCALTLAQWTGALSAAVTPYPEALELAATIGRRASLAVLTNNNLLVAREIDVIFPALRPIFHERFVVSAQLGARKPAPEAYHRCLARLGMAARTTLFVDDNADNVAGARQAGLRGHVYAGAALLATELRREGLLAPTE